MVRHESLKSLLAADNTDPLDYITPETCVMYVKAPSPLFRLFPLYSTLANIHHA